MPQVLQKSRKTRRIGLFVIVGLVIIVAVGAVLLVPRLLGGTADQTSDSIISSALATTGDVSTTVSGSGSLAEASIKVEVPVGITVDDVYVHSGESITEGDVLAAVDTDSVAEVIDLVEDERDELASALSELGGSVALDRLIAAYDVLLSDLNVLYASGYVKANATGTIGSVNVKKGDTITASTGASSSSADSDSSGSTGNGAFGQASLSGSAAGGVFSTAELSGSTGWSFGSAGVSGSSGGTAFGQASISDSGQLSPLEAPEEEKAGPELSVLPYATATVSQARAACVASAKTSQEEATRLYLITLCEARIQDAAGEEPAGGQDAPPLGIDVDYGAFAPVKGVYPVVFSLSDKPTETKTCYVVLEDDSGGSGGGSNDTGGGGSANTGGSGAANTGSGSAGAGSTGSGSTGTTGAASATEEEELVLDSVKAPAFQINSADEVEVQLQLDELDVAAVKVGQQATVELSALEDEVFEGTVSSVSVSGTSYYAVITIPRTEGMYVGFSATATIIKEQATGVVLIPLDAVQQRGDEVFVYTTVTDDGELGGETPLETGLSDENTVEVLNGLDEGTTVYYRQQISSSAASTDSGGFGNMGNRGGGQTFEFSGELGGPGGGGQMPNFGGNGGGPVQIPGQ
ncbi:MAG: efflux RND transporter periplasmic adaptor subunit [Coriobacteriales bacterium]|jgi:multidrug efflux pump subunit AcrA (membrane-fusion protein)|nr:efflux RND transporter periplasmic adaptor subunit [Coriobacteriales bacterium]